MADILDTNGLTLQTYNEILSYIQNSLNEIYAQDGDTINFGSETPDGQFTNILAQISSDVRQLASEIYNSFNPDNCQGSIQDQRYALNFITRKGGKFTIQNIDITTDRTVTLEGLDSNYNSLTASSYTVSDNAGNQWYLIDTTTITAGTTSLPFRSQNLGLVQPTVGTITNQVTKVLGVTSVNNSVAPTTLGEDEESDAEFRIRRDRSTSTSGQNNYDAMVGQILQIADVTDAKIFVNNTATANTTVTGDANNGVPPYNVWVIVEGGANDDIANAIYQNSAGLATYGYENLVSGITPTEVNLTTTSGQIVTVLFNRVNPVPLYIRYDLKVLDASLNIDDDAIKNNMVENISFALNQPAETSYLTEIASTAISLTAGSGAYALNLEISTDNNTWTDFIPSNSWMDKFVVSADNITITQV